jgi:hypothetical protein
MVVLAAGNVAHQLAEVEAPGRLLHGDLAVKRRLRLDDDRSRVMLAEANRFV